MKCKCKLNYKVTTIKHLGGNEHSDPFEKTIFKEGSEYFYHNDKKYKTFYVSDTQEHIRNIDYYNIFVEELEEDEFNVHFEKIN